MSTRLRPSPALTLILCVLFLPALSSLLSLTGSSAFAQAPAGGSKSMWSFLTEGNFDPVVEGSYGYGMFGHKLFTADLPATATMSLKLGFREVKTYKSWGKKLDERFLIGTYGKSTIPPGKEGSGGTTGEWWRVGTGQRSGYGWELGKQALIPYHQYSFDIAEPTFTPGAGLTPGDSAILLRTAGDWRFGMSTEGGFDVELFSSIAASAGYEMSVIYPRVVFPKWFGSYLLLGSSIVVITNFAEEILKTSPFFGPILYFVLRNGVAYAFFYAFRGDMNWPFPSETPMMVQTLKLNVSIRF
jgi:hypothetical protein